MTDVVISSVGSQGGKGYASRARVSDEPSRAFSHDAWANPNQPQRQTPSMIRLVGSQGYGAAVLSRFRSVFKGKAVFLKAGDQREVRLWPLVEARDGPLCLWLRWV